MSEFLLEIGVEEIPASFLEPAARALEESLRIWFKDNRIACGSSRILYTPRRLAVKFQDVAEAQASLTMEVQGPPRKAAFDAQGQPTKTAVGFARTHGKELADLTVKTTPRGEYVFVTKTIAAQPSVALLAQALPDIISRLPFPKNMRWSAGGLRFARPIRWLVALLDGTAIPFVLDEVTAGNVTHGHRLAQPGQVTLNTPADYEPALERLDVTADPVRRREEVVTRIQAALGSTGGAVIADDELLDETANLVETPVPVVCRFAAEYLELPAIVTVTALKKHQRCFAVRSHTGALLPQFVAVTNTPGCDVNQVRGWYEKAAESRLRDARFFIEEDRKIGLEGFQHLEEQVTWMEGLGTLKDKTARLVELSAELAATVNASNAREMLDGAPQVFPTFVTTSRGPTRVDAEALRRAALLCKADLLSNMVREKEYTSLQGVMGGIYARMQGESESTSQAISDHYSPRSVGDPVPATVAGRLLSIADKLDNIAAAFRIGEIPTGSEDPLALRRQATGVLAMLLETNWPLDLQNLLSKTLSLLPGAGNPAPSSGANSSHATLDQLCQFFRERLRLLLEDRGVKYDTANAALATSWSRPADALARCNALARFREKPEFEDLVQGQKRVANILRKASPGAQVNVALLNEPAEQKLHQAAQALLPALQQSLAAQDYAAAMEQLLSLRTDIDRFFDDVMVMCEDHALSANRLALLAYVKGLFLSVADLSQIVIETKG
jgi:glycyl-tRNA synthetase beta chain